MYSKESLLIPEFENVIGKFIIAHVIWQPIDFESSSLHASEPGHLSFGKLVNGNIEFLNHLCLAHLTG